MDNSSSMIAIQIAYADHKQQLLIDLSVPANTTIQDALLKSNIAQQGVDISQLAVGIYGKKKELDTIVREHDRIELYRPLVADPKDSRRRRVEKERKDHSK